MKTTNLKSLFAAAALAMTLPTAVWAAGEAADMTAAEVRKVDAENGKVTLKHGPIKNLDMPGMTMVFAVKDKAMLDKVKAGDKVMFKAMDVAGKYTVTELKSAN